MKNKICLVICLVFFGVLLGGCSISIKDVIDKTSDFRHHYFLTQTDFGNIEFYCGQRELEYEYNGISTKKVDYGIISISLKEKLNEKTLPISLCVDDYTYNIILEQNPFDDSYMYDIEKQVNPSSNIVVKFNTNKFPDTILECQSSKWKIDSSTALEISSKCLQDILKDNSKNGKDFECYLRISHNIQNNEMLYFWTFSVKTNDLKSSSVVIDVNSGEILVKRIGV